MTSESDINRWRAPEEVTGLAPAQRVSFALACAEHLYPSFALQVHAHPASLPASALAVSEFRACADALWQWLAVVEDTVPDCVTEQHVDATESEQGAVDGLDFLVPDAIAALWYARRAPEDPEGCRASGSRALNAAGQLAEAALGPRPMPSAPATVEDARRLSAERLEAMARHELVELERAAQDEAVAALTGGADPATLRAPAQTVGARIAEWAARLL